MVQMLQVVACTDYHKIAPISLGRMTTAMFFLRTLAIRRWYPDPRYYHFPLPNDVNIKNDLPISLKTQVSQDEFPAENRNIWYLVSMKTNSKVVAG